jgi:hypothetical protein
VSQFDLKAYSEFAIRRLDAALDAIGDPAKRDAVRSALGPSIALAIASGASADDTIRTRAVAIVLADAVCNGYAGEAPQLTLFACPAPDEAQ